MPLYRPCSCGVFAPGQDHAVFNTGTGGAPTFSVSTLFFYTINSVVSGPSLTPTPSTGTTWGIAVKASNFALFWSGTGGAATGTAVRYFYVPRTIQNITVTGPNNSGSSQNHACGNTEFGLLFAYSPGPTTTNNTWTRIAHSTNVAVAGTGIGFSATGGTMSAANSYALLAGGLGNNADAAQNLNTLNQLLYATLTNVARPTTLATATAAQVSQCNGITGIFAGGLINAGGGVFGTTTNVDSITIATEVILSAAALPFALSYSNLTQFANQVTFRMGSAGNTGQAVFNTVSMAGWGGGFASYDYSLNTWTTYFSGYLFSGAGA